MSTDPHVIHFEDIKAALSSIGIDTKDLKSVSFLPGVVEVVRTRRDPQRGGAILVEPLNDVATETVTIRVERAPKVVQA